MVRRYLRAAYGAATWRRLLFAIAGGPLGAVGILYVLAVVYPSVILLVTLLGLPILAAGLLGARWLGGRYRRVTTALLGLRIERPPPFRAAPGLIGWIRSGLADATGWRAAAYL